MRLEVLMSVMYQENFDIALKTKVESDLLIINQCDREGYDEITHNGYCWRMISTTTRGLSKSRNIALDNARGDICLLCDDDQILYENYAEKIISAYEKLPDATCIAFNIDRINYNTQKSYYKITEVKIAPKYRGYGSPMLTFRKEEINRSHIRFNEKFGSGTQWGGGEDILFHNAIRNVEGYKFYEYPETITLIDYSGGSQWFHGYDEEAFYRLGGFTEYSLGKNFPMKLLRCLYTAKKHGVEYLSFCDKMLWMYRGMKGIKKDITYKEYIECKKGRQSK